MEERLFLVGLAMGAYAWASRRLSRTGALNTPLRAASWHAIFCALAGFSTVLVLLLSAEGRSNAMAAETLPAIQLGQSLAAAAVAAAAGFWRARASRQPAKREARLADDAEWSETVFSAVLLASLLMYFVVQAFKIPSGSMESTLLVGDHLFVNKFIYGLRVPLAGKRVLPLRAVERGDVVVFRFPDDDLRAVHCAGIQYGRDFIKRVIALPGDKVRVTRGALSVNDRLVGTEPYAQFLDGSDRRWALDAGLGHAGYQEAWQSHSLDRRLEDTERDEFGPVTVPPESYFVMGDNRDRSCDSRYWGPVESRYLKGKAWFIYWPPDRARLVR